MRLVVIAFSLIMLATCCSHKEIPGKYYLNGKPPGSIKLNVDSTFNTDFGELGYSFGKWRKKGNKIVLRSKYKECCIDSIRIINSTTDTSKFMHVSLKLFGKSYGSQFAYLILDFSDTITLEKPGGVSILKKEYKYIQLVEQLGGSRYPKSKILPFNVSDSVKIEYDFGVDRFYRFYYDEKYKINSKKRTLNEVRKCEKCW